jgi:hypothetical protein
MLINTSNRKIINEIRGIQRYKSGHEHADAHTLLYRKAKDKHQLGTRFLFDEGNTSVAKKADFVINIMNYL